MLQNPQLHYLDNAATTIVAPEVADVINKAMRSIGQILPACMARARAVKKPERRPRRRSAHAGLQKPGAVFYLLRQ